MQLRCSYTHTDIKCRQVSAEPFTFNNQHLLHYLTNGSPQPGQKTLYMVTTPQSYETHLQKILKGTGKNNFTPAFINVDEFHETRSEDATIPKLIRSIQCEWEAAIDTDNPTVEEETSEERCTRLTEA